MTNKYHYVYRITNTQMNKHYYGVRSSKVEPKLDLGIKYFSSYTDKGFIKEQKENKSIFKYKVIKQFNSRKDADKYEIKLHTKFNVGINETFYNKCNALSPHVYTCENKLAFWKNASYTFKLMHSINTAKGVAESWKNLNNEEYKNRCNNISKALIGKKEPEWKKKTAF